MPLRDYLHVGIVMPATARVNGSQPLCRPGAPGLVAVSGPTAPTPRLPRRYLATNHRGALNEEIVILPGHTPAPLSWNNC
jgi:hypothetical protein